MKNEILKLIDIYKTREHNLSAIIKELMKNRESNKEELKAANLARTLWRQAIQDLEKIIR